MDAERVGMMKSVLLAGLLLLGGHGGFVHGGRGWTGPHDGHGHSAWFGPLAPSVPPPTRGPMRCAQGPYVRGMTPASVILPTPPTLPKDFVCLLEP